MLDFVNPMLPLWWETEAAVRWTWVGGYAKHRVVAEAVFSLKNKPRRMDARGFFRLSRRETVATVNERQQYRSSRQAERSFRKKRQKLAGRRRCCSKTFLVATT